MVGRTPGVTTLDEALIEEARTNETGIAFDQSEVLDVVTEPGGYATLYDTRTGEASKVRLFEGRKTLDKYLAKTDPTTGARVFSMNKPKIKRPVAEVPCWMNPKSERFEEFSQIGSIVGNGCPKMLFNVAQVRDHMQNTHPEEYAAAERERNEGREDRLAEALSRLGTRE